MRCSGYATKPGDVFFVIKDSEGNKKYKNSGKHEVRFVLACASTFHFANARRPDV